MLQPQRPWLNIFFCFKITYTDFILSDCFVSESRVACRLFMVVNILVLLKVTSTTFIVAANTSVIMIYWLAYSGCMLTAAWSARNWVVWHTVPIWSIHHVLLQMVCWNWKKKFVLLQCTIHDPFDGHPAFSLDLKKMAQKVFFNLF